jgi:hypothetical protein
MLWSAEAHPEGQMESCAALHVDLHLVQNFSSRRVFMPRLG